MIVGKKPDWLHSKRLGTYDNPCKCPGRTCEGTVAFLVDSKHYQGSMIKEELPLPICMQGRSLLEQEISNAAE